MEAAGIEISRGLLWDHRSANARAVLGFMEGHWSTLCPDRTHECHKVPHSECAERVFSHSWCITCAPIVLQQWLLKLHNEHRVAHFDPLDAQQSNTLNVFLIKLFHMATDVLKTVRQSAEDGVNTFAIDHNWQEPTRALPAEPVDCRKHLRRKDPLPFPDVPPPITRTHFHGRWTQFQGQRRVVWVEHAPCSFKEMLTDVPPNLPVSNEQWAGRTVLGGDHSFKGGEQVAELIHSFQNALGIVTDNEWHGGPPVRQEVQLPHGKIETKPHDGLDRSPLRVGECTSTIDALTIKNHPRPSPVPAPAPAPTPTPAPVPIPNPATGLQGVPGPPNLKTILGEAANQRQSQDELKQAKEELTRLKSMLPDISPLQPEGGSIHALDAIQPNPNSHSFMSRFGLTAMGLKNSSELRNHFGSRAFSGDPYWDNAWRTG